MALDIRKLRALHPPGGLCFKIRRLGHVRPANEWKGIRTLEAAVANPVVGQDATPEQ